MNIRTSDEILFPISIGKLIDKISILKIKLNKMNGKQLSNVKNELKALEAIVKEKNLVIAPSMSKNLNEVNLLLWEIEDKIRLKEMNNMFDNEFIQLARSVYQQNDKRASLKRKINCMYNSQFIEEKLYS